MKNIGGKKPINETLLLNYNDSVNANGKSGNDIYIINDNQKKSATITDTQGKNVIVFANDTHIVSSKVSNNTLKITLENKAVITINKASTFSFKIGGNIVDNQWVNQPTDNLKYADFIKQIGKKQFDITSFDLDKIGTIQQSKEIDANQKSMTFEGSPLTTRSYVDIKNFGKDDYFQFKNMTQDDFATKSMILSDELGNVDMIFNTSDSGELYKIKLLGVANPNEIVFDLETFNQLPVGDILFG